MEQVCKHMVTLGGVEPPAATAEDEKWQEFKVNSDFRLGLL